MPRIDLSSVPVHSGSDALGAFERQSLTAAGGLTQFGVALETLMPGASSSNRHWHEGEDECLYVLDGTADLVENSGTRAVGPGDVICWPKGVANAHHLINRSDAPMRFLVAGWHADRDVVHYPDVGEIAHEDAKGNRKVTKADVPSDPSLPSGLIDRSALSLRTGSGYPEPYFSMMKKRSAYQFGAAGGLTQFGANLVMLEPGGLASMRHWHEKEDEFAIVTAGVCTLIEDTGRVEMGPGEMAAWPAGVANGHVFANESDAPAAFLVFGSRAENEIAHYSDIDMIFRGGLFTRRDGSAIEAG